MACNFSREQDFHARGIFFVAGVDEAGRGPLAGPVVAAAIILSPNFDPSGLNDSKKLSPRRREQLFDKLTNHSDVSWAVAQADVHEIDSLNILRATHLAMARAIDALKQTPDHALVDGLPVRGLSVPHTAVVGGDALCLSIAAASILAKVARDRIMLSLDAQYPQYGFARHKGYGVRSHIEALLQYGPSPVHRRSFAPVAKAAASTTRP